MGAESTRAARLGENGDVLEFAINDKCASGTGVFLDAMARLMGVALEEMGPLSLTSTSDLAYSSTCVVFARHEVLAYLRRGVPRSAVLAGACNALANRVHAMLRKVGVEEEFVISGGIARNPGVVRRLEQKLKVTARIHEHPQLVGALGAALFARDLAARQGSRRSGPS